MDWIKKHSDQFALALVAFILLVLSALIFLRTQSFAEGFSDALATPPHNRDIQKVDTTVLDEAQQQLGAPAQWTVKPEEGSVFVSKKTMVGPDGSLVLIGSASMTHPPVPDAWLLKYELDILSPGVLEADPDKDGFSNLDEYLGPDRSAANEDADSTDPRKKDAHPPYYTKLFLKQFIKVPFRLLFNSYDGDPKKDAPEKMSFQINTVDLRQPTEFLELGKVVNNTKFKLVKFEYKTRRNESIGEDEDVSELTVQNIETGESIVLVYTKVTDSPDSFALFGYLWPQPPQDIRVKKLQEFVLKPTIQERYKLIDIKETEAVIQLPTGEKYTVPLLKK